MKAIKVVITSFISDDQPGWVECNFFDAWNKEHIAQDKVPILTDMDLDENSKYPVEGEIHCEILNEWKDNDERKIFTVTTKKPWWVDTKEGLTEFDLLEEQLIELP